MDTEKIKEIVRAAVDDSLTKKERAEALTKMEAVIAEAKADIDELTEALESKDAVVEEKDAALVALIEEKEAVDAKISEKDFALEEALSKVENLEADVSEKAATIESSEVAFTDLKAKFDELDEKVKAVELAERLSTRLSKLEEAGLLRVAEDAADKQKESVNAMSEEEFASYISEMAALREEFSVSREISPKELASLDIETVTVDMNKKYKELGEALAKQ